jgi:hypothetical protein
VGGGGVRVLGDVRVRLRDDVVRRHFDASGQAAVEVRLQRDGDRRALDEHLKPAPRAIAG